MEGYRTRSRTIYQTTPSTYSILIRVQEYVVRRGGDLLKSSQGEEYIKTTEKESEPIDKEVLAMLVYKDSKEGCVRISGRTVKNVITGQKDDKKVLLVFIGRCEKGWIYGQPRVRFYRRTDGHD